MDREVAVSPSTDGRRNREPVRELKFLVSRVLGAEIHRWAGRHLAPDPYADPSRGNTYTITSLYFDTAEFHVFRRVGSFARSKYRIRRYDDHGRIFLERKLKTNGRVSKRRTPASLEDLNVLSEAYPERAWGGFWYHRRLLARQLRPVCQIHYRRAAWMAPNLHEPFRLTLDEGIGALATAQAAFDDTSTGLALLSDKVVVEIKFRQEPPALGKLLLQEFALQPRAVSKYRLAATALGLVKSSAVTAVESAGSTSGNGTPTDGLTRDGRNILPGRLTETTLRNQGARPGVGLVTEPDFGLSSHLCLNG